MTTGAENSTSHDVELDESIEKILGKASPRPVPSDIETADVRRQVHAEWQKVAGRRQTKRRFMSLAMAASVLIAVTATFTLLRNNGVSEIQVASIDKNVGSVYVLGENSELLASNNLTSIVAGQILITNAASGVGLAWGNGGSLRIDENTRVEFVARDTIVLHSGQIYFDSKPHSLAYGQANVAAKLLIQTEFGTVTHVGTQYMTRVQRDSLTVSVREGEISLESGSGFESASGGEQLQLQKNGRPSRVNINVYGDDWNWTEGVTPEPDLQGRPIYDFLSWVSHETGLTLEFADSELEYYAQEQRFSGAEELGPSAALQFWNLGSDLELEIVDGVIRIDAAGRQTED